MPDIHLNSTEPTPPNPTTLPEPGEMRVMEEMTDTTAIAPAPSADVTPLSTAAQRRLDQAATIEHLAARQSVSPLDANIPEVKQRLSDLRTEATTLVTGLRWDGVSVEETAERLIPLIDIGPLQQWIALVVPTLLEIDRAGNLIPVWFKIIEQEDPQDIAPGENPAETTIGRARRYGILMLGYYKSPEVSRFLGSLATDPHSSLYATRSLIKQSTVAALQALTNALKDAKGWAKVDVVDAFALLNLARFHELLLASGLDSANELESYVAAPLYRTLPLERYLRGGKDIPPRLTEQATLIFSQVLQDSMRKSAGTEPIVFERDLPMLANALFEGARSAPTWQYVVALHRLASLLGRYWADISRGAIQDSQIVQPIYATLPIMPEVERWMNGTGRNVLLAALSSQDEAAFSPALKVLTEIREPRAASILMERLESTSRVTSLEEATLLSHICNTLGLLGDRQAVPVLIQFAHRVVDMGRRTNSAKRRENLAAGDPDIPGSVIYAAVIRALAKLGDRSSISFIALAVSDLDPYVRVQALEALKSIDPNGSEMASREAMHRALNDPSDAVIHSAIRLAKQYRDSEALPWLRQLAETRPDFASDVNDASRQLQGL